ncbi:MAG: hemolysin family protein [Chitinophagaceae bacterium]
MNNAQLSGLILTLILTGFFVGIDIAFASVNKLSIELKKKKGGLSGKILSKFVEFPGRYLKTSIVGINILLVLFCLLATEVLRPFWENIFSGAINNPLLKILVETFLFSSLIFLFGDLIPRVLFRSRPDGLLTIFALPILFFYRLLYPIGAFFISVAEWILQYLFDVRMSDKKTMFNRSDPEQFIRQVHPHAMDNQELNTELFENALSLVHVKIRECMVPRKEIEALEIHASSGAARKRFIDSKLSKLIVYENNIDNILGYIHQLDMFKNPPDIAPILHPILAIPETMSATDLMGKFTKERKSIAWVVDEFGGTAGIVTMEDVLEEIFGEIKDEHDTEDFVEKQIAEKEYILSGRLEIDYLNEKFKFGLPDNGSETLSGLIISHHETIPSLKERIIIDHFEFDILNVTDTRIEMVKLKILQ